MKRIWLIEYRNERRDWRVALWVGPRGTRSACRTFIKLDKSGHQLRPRKYVPAEGKR